MERITQQIVEECKEIIERKTFALETLQEYWLELHTFEYEVCPDWAWIFQKVYIHACLKKKADVANWLKTVFEASADPIQKIAYRQTYAYGNHLLHKAMK